MAEVERLRALIKSVEDNGEPRPPAHDNYLPWRDGKPCPWCNRYRCETAPGGHAKDCPAFTPEGELR